MRSVSTDKRPLISHAIRLSSSIIKRYATQVATRTATKASNPSPPELVPRYWRKTKNLPEEQQALIDDKNARAVRHARLELRWIKDKVTISQRIRTLLQENRPALALEMTKIASQQPDHGVVAWNHLIEYHLKKNPPHIDTAWKFFNNMKTRQQTPDSYTLTILLNGILRNPHEKGAADKAYRALSTYLKDRDKKFGKANHKHFNQVLTICARSGDTQTLWKVLEILPESGKDKPSSQTYTIALQTLNNALQKEGIDEAEIQSHIESALKIWNIAVERWCKKAIQIDSYMVNAMANILLKSNDPKMQLAILDLVQQTVGLKKCPPAVRRNPRYKSVLKLDNEVEDEALDPSELFPLLRPGKGSLKLDKSTELVPINYHIIQTIFQLCQIQRAKGIAEYYWNELNDRADLPNFKSYLEVLRLTRSSTDALEAVKSFSISATPDVGVYQMAMAACARNPDRKDVADVALELYQHRSNYIKEADMKFLNSMLSVARNTDDPQKCSELLEIISKDAALCLSYRGLGWKAANTVKPSDREFLIPQTVQVVKLIIGEIDRLLNTSMADPKLFAQSTAKLNEFIRRAGAKQTNPRKEE